MAQGVDLGRKLLSTGRVLLGYPVHLIYATGDLLETLDLLGTSGGDLPHQNDRLQGAGLALAESLVGGLRQAGEPWLIFSRMFSG